MKAVLTNPWPLSGGNYTLPAGTILTQTGQQWTALLPQDPSSIFVQQPFNITLPPQGALPADAKALDQAAYNLLFQWYGGFAWQLLYDPTAVIPRH